MNQHFINGRYVAGQTGETLAKLDPATGEEFARIACGNAADIDAAVTAARAAFDGAWGRLTAAERGRLISKLAVKVQDNFDELAKLEARDTGKPMSQARADIDATIRYFEFYGGAADKVHGHVIPFLNGYHVSVVHEPHGVTGHILPWNYPAQMIGRSLTASLAMGNTVVLKPAEDACSTAFRLAELASEVGFPDGAINIVAGRGHEAGAALSAHLGIGFMSFTGSPEVGKMVQHACAEHLIPCTLELGGKSPQIVFEDADIEAFVPIACKAIVQNTGQTCSAGSRLLIQKSIYDDVVAEVAKAFSKLQAGTPEMDLDCGPVINAKQRGRVQSFVQQSREAGIPVLAEGRIAQGVPNGGFYVQPTLFGPVPRGNRLEQEEVFGPVLGTFPFEDEEDAIKTANGTDFGLVAAVWTKDGGRQQRVAKRVRAGQVFINGYGAGGGIELPFGGTGKSGHGREKGFIALEEFAVTKTIVHKHG